MYSGCLSVALVPIEPPTPLHTAFTSLLQHLIMQIPPPSRSLISTRLFDTYLLIAQNSRTRLPIKTIGIETSTVAHNLWHTGREKPHVAILSPFLLAKCILHHDGIYRQHGISCWFFLQGRSQPLKPSNPQGSLRQRQRRALQQRGHSQVLGRARGTCQSRFSQSFCPRQPRKW